MNAIDYQKQALVTWDPGDDRDKALLYLAGKLSVEAAETAQVVIKAAFHGKSVSSAEVAAEIGDLLWYAAVLASEYNLPLEFIMEQNIQKLRERHGNRPVREWYARL